MNYSRAILRDVEGYVPGEQPADPAVIKLNTNENPYPPSPKVVEALRGVDVAALRKYPDPVSLGLRTVCAERYGYASPDWVIAGNGMDELLAMALRTFTDPGDTILTPYPTYSLYETLAKLHGAHCKTIDLSPDFQLTSEFFTTPARLCFLPRPNAPSGVAAPLAEMERLCTNFDGIVVIDEAYVDFADDSCLEFPKRFDNVIVMRTFSKSFSLAGQRLGVAVARPELIAEFMKTKDSYNLNAISQAVGIAAMQDYAYMESNVRKIRATRQRLADALKKLGFTVSPSQANFVLAQRDGTPSSAEIFHALREQNILVRYFDTPGLQNALRVSVGTDAEIDTLLERLREILA